MELLMNIDRRFIFACVFIIVTIILLNPLGLPVPVGRHAQNHYDFMESLPDGGVLWIDPAYGPGSEGELGPMIRATAHHAFSKDMRIISFSMHWELGPELAHRHLTEVGAQYGKEYGVDWITLGYQAGGAPPNLQAAVRSLAEARPTDWAGVPISQFPLTQEVKRLGPEYVDHIMVYASGNPGTEDYLNYVVEPEGVSVSEGSIQMSIANALPFLDAGQYKSIIPGSRGAAEYELLIGQPGMAIGAQDVLSMAALFVTLLLIIGNVGYFITRSKES